jgi:hypothetical protein
MGKEKGKMDPDIKKLILWRIETSVPEHFKLVMGDMGAFGKEELKKHVEKEDDVGMRFAEMELKFIKALSSGEFTRRLVE